MGEAEGTGWWEEDEQMREMTRAIHLGEPADVQILAVSGIDLSLADQNGDTALHMAVYTDDTHTASELINYGSPIDAQNKLGQTPLHIAAGRGHVAMVTLLLNNNADIDIKSKYSEMTALHMASQNSHTEVVNQLLVNNADVNITDVINKSAAHYAGNQTIQELLASRRPTDKPATADADRHHLGNRVLSDNSSRPQVYNHDHSDNNTKHETDRGNVGQAPAHKQDSKNINHKLKFSKDHKKKMQVNVFDRLTRRKSQLLKK